MMISWSPPDAASVPTTERPVFDRKRAASVCVIVTLVNRVTRALGPWRGRRRKSANQSSVPTGSDGRAWLYWLRGSRNLSPVFTVLRNRFHNKLALAHEPTGGISTTRECLAASPLVRELTRCPH